MANLLIVDDELSMRQFLTHLFQRDGHAIRVAENGRKAMAMLREQTADVIISDVKMPDMGGIELLRAARELNPDIEVIMMTAFANEQTAHEAFLLGAFDFRSQAVRQQPAEGKGRASAAENFDRQRESRRCKSRMKR